jgi:hypothetical protein
VKEQFIVKDFRPDKLRLIRQVNRVLDQYRAMGYDLTLRQVYYQLVSKDLIPNNIQSYKRLGTAISDGRKTGLIDWDMIVDRTRSVVIPPHWDDPADIVNQAAKAFRIDKWADQPNHVEVMVEKEALAGILEPVCRDLDIAFTANKGYSSDSAMYRAGKRIGEEYFDNGKSIFILYLGDHDPSGLDMDRDIFDRLEMFGELGLEVERLALLMAQIEQMDVPENPAKMSDSRAKAYVARFGPVSWELDAMEPTELARLVTEAVGRLRDEELWQAALEREEEMRQELKEFADDYGSDDEDS